MAKFKEPLKPKAPTKKMKSPWNFSAPEYDKRSSEFVSAGTNYGTGFKQPVGNKGNPSVREKRALPLESFSFDTDKPNDMFANKELEL